MHTASFARSIGLKPLCIKKFIKYLGESNSQDGFASEQKGCPFDCGLCNNHTLLGNIDLTSRCNKAKGPLVRVTRSKMAAKLILDERVSRLHEMARNYNNRGRCC